MFVGKHSWVISIPELSGIVTCILRPALSAVLERLGLTRRGDFGIDTSSESGSSSIQVTGKPQSNREKRDEQNSIVYC